MDTWNALSVPHCIRRQRTPWKLGHEDCHRLKCPGCDRTLQRKALKTSDNPTGRGSVVVKDLLAVARPGPVWPSQQECLSARATRQQ
jgi:hypothetical protein